MDNNTLEQKQLLEQDERMREQYMNLQKKLIIKKTSWLRFLVTTITILLSILVSLGQPDYNVSQYAGISFLSGVVTLTISIACLIICLYGDIDIIIRGRASIKEEADNAYHARRVAKTVEVYPRSIVKVCERIGYASFLIALVCLCVYTYFSIFSV